MIIWCVCRYKFSETESYRRGILVEVNNPYTEQTYQVIIDSFGKPVDNIYNFIRCEELGCFLTNFN